MTRDLWDDEAAHFDDEPDHGLADPQVRSAWRELLLEVLPAAPGRVADLGCGTGTLTRLLTDEGYVVDGLDLSPEMIRRARVKVPEAEFVVGDAARPALEPGAYDVVLSRHVLWAMPDPAEAFARWVELLRPGGVVVLVEGRWSTGAGLTAAECEEIVRPLLKDVWVRPLPEPVYWGKTIEDERYLLVSRSSSRGAPAPDDSSRGSRRGVGSRP
ncbi:class I SAM-dependent methyltransferase [Ornithinimicrobium humiphilum]|uniref:Methyltransferase family protein n=1 Tax=Ornithinimicrobium humiphilum TaxID=125288 RepID=A0A543KP31_9MICO|nr:class I SAM-dependent methyltransferase [Ornithinimicrobium humiphilum]TQM96827.1 methyltransferase family protein [Ornithinimicrobium humiphilum]